MGSLRKRAKLCGQLMVALALAFYAGTWFAHWTALIPAIVGLLIFYVNTSSRLHKQPVIIACVTIPIVLIGLFLGRRGFTSGISFVVNQEKIGASGSEQALFCFLGVFVIVDHLRFLLRSGSRAE